MQLVRLICVRCLRTLRGVDDGEQVKCPHCSGKCIAMVDWVRRRMKKTKVEK